MYSKLPKLVFISYWPFEGQETAQNRLRSFYNSIDATVFQPLFYEHQADGVLRRGLLSRTLHRCRRQIWVKLLIGVYRCLPLKKSLAAKQFYLYNNPANRLDRLILKAGDIVFASHPCFDTVQMAYKLCKKSGASLVVDYRDPHTFGYRPLHHGLVSFWFYKKYYRKREERVLSCATRIVVAHESFVDFFPRSFHHKIHCIENAANDKYSYSDSFQIAYGGTLYPQQLSDTAFFEAYAQLIQRYGLKPAHTSLILLGTEHHPALTAILQRFKLRDYSKNIPRLDTKTALDVLKNMQILLLLRYKGYSEIVSSKYYDYLLLDKPILLPCSDNGVLEKNIRRYNAGLVCNSSDECFKALENWYLEWRREGVISWENTADKAAISRSARGRELKNMLATLIPLPA